MAEAHDWSRRGVLATLMAGALVGPTYAQPAAKPLARGPLAGNALANSFRAAPAGLRLPDMMLAGPKGPRPLSSLRGRTLLIPLWAEWCTPCLAEMPDFAGLQARHGNARFAITPLLTGSKRKMGPAEASRLLAKVRAARFEALVEPNGGDRLYKTLTADPARGGKPTLPCNLVVDPTGRVVARQFGAMMVSAPMELKDIPPEMRPKPGQTVTRTITLTEAQKRKMMAGAQSGAAGSIWGSPAGDALVAALAAGLVA